MDRDSLHIYDDTWSVGILDIKGILDAVSYRCSIWTWRRGNRRIRKSLCGESLFKLGDEFPALLLWSVSRDQPVHHGAGIK